MADIEEISLHQMEIERIEVLGTLCRKLKILYLQNNIIPRIENLHHLKDLRYLNMALNNVTKIEGLRQSEFLNKLDLTCNFVDVDALEESMLHLQPLLHLKCVPSRCGGGVCTPRVTQRVVRWVFCRELFCMGCPFEDWDGHRLYVIGMLPQVQQYNGKDVLRSERIKAAQNMGDLRATLRDLANAKLKEKGLPERDFSELDEEEEDDGLSPWTVGGASVRFCVADVAHPNRLLLVRWFVGSLVRWFVRFSPKNGSKCTVNSRSRRLNKSAAKST